MATALTEFGTYNDYRAVLGVDSDELEDTTLALELYSSFLEMELAEVSEDVPAEYVTVKAIAELSRTTEQAVFYAATRLFALYAVANQLGTSLPLFSPKDITDGKASISRYADSPYRDTLKNVTKNYDRLKNKLAAAYSTLSSSSNTVPVRNYFAVSSPTYDPVVG